MVNNFFQTIHNKYNRFFKFLFFLRYLLVIFIIFTILFLISPTLFNYDKRAKVIKNYLLVKYNLEISQYEKIKYKSFPIPTLEINNAVINIQSTSLKLYVKNLKLRPKLISIYNYNNFQTNKVILKNNNLSFDASDLKIFIKYLLEQKNNLILKNLNIEVKNNNKKLIKLEKIKFSNFGYKKNLIEGEIFNKEFQVKINENSNKINFELKNSGLSSEINLNTDKKSDQLKGIIKTKILQTNIIINFLYYNKKIKILDYFFRNKNLTFKGDSLIELEPFLNANSNIVIEDFNFDYIKKLKFEKFINSKDFIKKISSKNSIKFFSKKKGNNLLDGLNLQVDLAYGRINFKKSILNSNSNFECKGNINLLEDYPLLFFDCFIITNNVKKLMKNFLIKKKYKIKNIKLKVKGNLNILNKKINFSKINMNDNYQASNEDLKYFKEIFESSLLDKSLIDIFSLKKIKKFITEIS